MSIYFNIYDIYGIFLHVLLCELLNAYLSGNPECDLAYIIQEMPKA